MGPRKSKKSETLQVRLPYGMKKKFMERVQLENRSASDLIRDFIESYLASPVDIMNSPKVVMIRRRFIYPGLIAAGLVGAVIIFMPNPGAAGILKSDFAAIDANHDGFIDGSEYRSPSPDAMLHPVPGRMRRPGPDGINMFDHEGRPLRVRTIHPGQKGEDLVAKPGEVLLTPAQMKQHLLNDSDADGDQKLSFEEYKQARLRGARSNFERYDVDVDDKVSREEYLAGRAPNLRPEVAERLEPAQVQAMKTSLPHRREMAAKVFEGLDRNHDGRLTRSEMIPS